MSFHNEIMNLLCVIPPGLSQLNTHHLYQIGHRDARHAAAELANKADAEIERLHELARDACEYAMLRQIEVLQLRKELKDALAANSQRTD
jgi:hypothetical protein